MCVGERTRHTGIREALFESIEIDIRVRLDHSRWESPLKASLGRILNERKEVGSIPRWLKGPKLHCLFRIKLFGKWLKHFRQILREKRGGIGESYS